VKTLCGPASAPWRGNDVAGSRFQLGFWLLCAANSPPAWWRSLPEVPTEPPPRARIGADDKLQVVGGAGDRRA